MIGDLVRLMVRGTKIIQQRGDPSVGDIAARQQEAERPASLCAYSRSELRTVDHPPLRA